MAPHAGESPPMAARASRLLQARGFARVEIHETRHMTRRLQCLRILRVTLRARKRRVDLVMAHQAVRHRRVIRLRQLTRHLTHPPMTRLTRIARCHRLPQVRCPHSQIALVVDRLLQRRRDACKLHMRLMRELHPPHRPSRACHHLARLWDRRMARLTTLHLP